MSPGMAADSQTLTAAASDPLTAEFSSMDDLCPELSTLQDLAARGSWRSILDKVARARSLSLLRLPHHHVIYLSFAALSLLKLHRFADAAAELDSLDDLDSLPYRYESYPKVYPDRYGSMVPFALRWLHAQIPLKLGKRPEAIDRFYTLLAFVRKRLEESEKSSVSAVLWRKREAFVLNSIISHHLVAKEYDVCFSLMQEMAGRVRFDAVLMSKLGYLQMQVGDLEGAKASFTRVEAMVKEGKAEELGSLSETEMKSLVSRNKALIYLVGKDYVSAVREYEDCIDRDGSDVVAINNKALCLMYLRDLSDSIKVLESALERLPTVALNEMVVVNLCSMYELAYVNHSDFKRTLSNWIVRVAPDDFDSSCTRV